MSDQDKPAAQRPEHPDFWCKRFEEGITPWDAGRVPADFDAFVSVRPTPMNTLIPGCGSGWEATRLAAAGWPVTALDFSPTAVARAREVLAGHAVELVCADFFNYTPATPPTLIYERAFLCALPRKLWPDWAGKVAALLPSGGLLAGYFFVCEQLKGPPFGIQPEQLDALLLPAFERIEDRPVADSIPVFAGRERWQVWRRRQDERAADR
ncbi:methyltransferase domain-containing protein [uncultured Azonexus sp.]|uniref:methyltransferase domain-containing protein n=1 Tax=uncultured Azonexus sp. TaxID=520307 RepID=UPI00260BB3C7|nr:methyltransferase domain-containing protein [uncultured Azonexus sp.]